jgi:hypothetical protein
MYNRILKRPMFKRGGPSYQAQGTGITSPFDTPRRQYNVGTSWEEIQENIRRSTADNTTTMQDVAQGFSHLGSPYKDDGSAKTVGEMIFEGSQAVSGSRADRAKTAQAGEIAAQEIAAKQLESDLAIAEAKKERDLKLELAKLAQKSDMLKKEPRNRQKARNRETLLKISQDPKNESSEFIGSYLNELADGYTDGDLASGPANVINPKLYTKDANNNWGYDSASLSVDRVWFDPITSQWLVFEDTNGDGMADGAPIYSSIDVEDSLTFFKQQPKKSVASEGDSVGDNAGTIKTEPKGDVDAEGNLKKKVNYSDIGDPTAGQVGDRDDMIATAIDTADQTGQDITSFWKWVSEPKRGKKEQVVKKADGGRIGYMDGSDPQATELNMLNKWWRDQLATTWKE